MTDITVVIPVGPHEPNRRWLGECLASVRNQTLLAKQILIIDDQAHLRRADVGSGIDIWKTPWLSGVAHAFNFGVALAENDLVVMVGSDDYLEPWAIEDCARAWEQSRDDRAYYSMDVRYLDTGETQWIACGAAMVSKDLWRHTGGFPVQAALGASDTMLLSILMGQRGAAGHVRRIDSSRGAPYVYRRHEGTDTVRNYGRFEGPITAVRDVLTRDWQPQAWAVQR